MSCKPHYTVLTNKKSSYFSTMAQFPSHLLRITLIAFTVGVVPPPGHAQRPVVTFAHGSCTPIVLQDLADIDRLSDTGLLHESLGARINRTSFRPLVRALDFHVVCEVAGITRGTVAAVSFVAEHECQGIPCTEATGNSTFQTDQLQYNCSSDFIESGGVDMVYEFSLFNERIRTANQTANFDTVPATRCGRCVDPAFGLTSDPETHCQRKRSRLLRCC